MIRSVNGHTIRFVDSTPSLGDKGALIIEDGHGNKIVMANTHMLIQAVGTLVIQGASITLNGRPVTPSPNPV
jgi:septal ring factor EnvC (AmiA/AmiB activator)